MDPRVIARFLPPLPTPEPHKLCVKHKGHSYAYIWYHECDLRKCIKWQVMARDGNDFLLPVSVYVAVLDSLDGSKCEGR
jgi:hypothetical protein